MQHDFHQLVWNDRLAEDCRRLIRLGIQEDLGREHDWTTVALVGPDSIGQAAIVSRQAGTIAGLPVARCVLQEMDPHVQFQMAVNDGDFVSAGQTVATMSGSARTLLTAERLLLNFLGHLSGVATLTQRYVAAVQATAARIYDTRKTTPGYRLLEKYAVHCGGGHNHRTGLYDAILIKDNHLAFGAESPGQTFFSPADAVLAARQFVAETLPPDRRARFIFEIEVDSLAQLEQVLPVGPDIVLLDNMPPNLLRTAVVMRDAEAPGTELEASGGVNLSTVTEIAQAGVDRISVGGLTHSALFDVGLDWLPGAKPA
ncbi:MAG TPA: carboxylating nicotinate-nucleotide diphosphorylase [Pirellulales bacterium]|nr:carboxylating nicotinate-nucleotide diphosphorylase [Pirellulales bacterium]